MMTHNDLVVNKKSMINHTLAFVVFMFAEKLEAAKEEVLLLAPCRVDFMTHFYWLVSKCGS